MATIGGEETVPINSNEGIGRCKGVGDECCACELIYMHLCSPQGVEVALGCVFVFKQAPVTVALLS